MPTVYNSWIRELREIVALFIWSVGQAVKLSPFHGDEAGPIPAPTTITK